MLRRRLQDERPTRRYPAHHCREGVTHDGLPLVIRSISPGDVPRLATFHAGLSEDSVRKRYFHYVSLHARIEPARLERICRPDHTSECVLVSILPGATRAGDQLVGVGRLEEVPGNRGELAILISDTVQHHGIGSLLMEEIIAVARGVGLTALIAYIAPYNTPMQHLCQHYGFTLDYPTEGGPMRGVLDLRESEKVTKQESEKSGEAPLPG